MFLVKYYIPFTMNGMGYTRHQCNGHGMGSRNSSLQEAKAGGETLSKFPTQFDVISLELSSAFRQSLSVSESENEKYP